MAPAARIETPRLLLRPWSADDAAALAAVLAASHAALSRWTPWVLEESATRDALRARLERYALNFSAGVEWRYAIVERANDSAILGGCGLHPRVGPGAIEIGYWLATAATGQGFATEAAAALTEAALRMPGIERIEIRCEPANDGSMRIPERLGYRALAKLVHEPETPGRPAADVVVWERRRGDRSNAAS
jgi:RimJ/RimL family protein N-acetyltransferase